MRREVGPLAVLGGASADLPVAAGERLQVYCSGPVELAWTEKNGVNDCAFVTSAGPMFTTPIDVPGGVVAFLRIKATGIGAIVARVAFLE